MEWEGGRYCWNGKVANIVEMGRWQILWNGKVANIVGMGRWQILWNGKVADIVEWTGNGAMGRGQQTLRGTQGHTGAKTYTTSSFIGHLTAVTFETPQIKCWFVYFCGYSVSPAWKRGGVWV